MDWLLGWVVDWTGITAEHLVAISRPLTMTGHDTIIFLESWWWLLKQYIRRRSPSVSRSLEPRLTSRCLEAYIEVLESFTYIGNIVHNSSGSRQEVLQRIGLARGAKESLNTSICCLVDIYADTKIRVFVSLLFSFMLYDCQILTLNSDRSRRISTSGNKCLHIIMRITAKQRDPDVTFALMMIIIRTC